jgi:uncharacterized protein (TIGR03118 family)
MKTPAHILATGLAALALTAAATAGAADYYKQRNLVSDNSALVAENLDQSLVNPWGLAFNPYGLVWVTNNGTGVSTLYDGDGKKQTLVVTVAPSVSGTKARPTGIVYYGGAGFVISQGALTGPSRFLFANEDGTIAAWAPNVSPTTAVKVIDRTSAKAVYKGLAISANGTQTLIYASDLHNGRVDVFDTSFKLVTLPAGAFRDPKIPAGYAPFGLQEINGDIYVTYARQDADREDDVKGRGLGYVSVFDPNGKFVRRFASRGALNAPWGIALAPASFGKFGNRLLVGNFGDGYINAYDLASGRWVGRLREQNQKLIQVDGLWGIAFGNGLNKQPTNTLFFSAGTDAEKHGLYGRLDPVSDDSYLKSGDDQ